MWHITGILVTNLSSSAGLLVILDREVDPAITELPASGAIFLHDAFIDGSSQFVDNMDHKTKYITMGRNDTSNIGMGVIIFGDIIKASRRELIIEWFRGGWR